MRLYRVRHVSKEYGLSYDNELVAASAAEAIVIRDAELGIGPHDTDDFEVTVNVVPDPDGRRAAFWLRHF